MSDFRNMTDLLVTAVNKLSKTVQEDQAVQANEFKLVKNKIVELVDSCTILSRNEETYKMLNKKLDYLIM